MKPKPQPKPQSLYPTLIGALIVVIGAFIIMRYVRAPDHAADVRAAMGKLPPYGFDKLLMTPSSKIIMQDDQAYLTYPTLEADMNAWIFGDCFVYSSMLRDRLATMPHVTSARIGQVILPADMSKGNSHLALWLTFDDGATLTLDPTPLTADLFAAMPSPTHYYDEATIAAHHENYRNGLSLALGQPMRAVTDPETGQHYYLMASIEKVQALDFNFILHAYAYTPATASQPPRFTRTTVGGVRFTADRLAEIRPQLQAMGATKAFAINSLTFIGDQSSDMRRILEKNSDILYYMVMRFDLDSLGAPTETPQVRFEAKVIDVETKALIPNIQIYVGGKALKPGQITWSIDITGNEAINVPIRVEADGYEVWDKVANMKVKANRLVNLDIQMKPIAKKTY